MSEIIAIVGQTGTGKSTSVRNLDPKETVIIGCTNKPLPFKGWKKNYTIGIQEGGNFLVAESEMKTTKGAIYTGTSSDKIVKVMKYISEHRPEIKQIIVDDFQYLMSSEFMGRSEEKGNQGWDKYIDIARHAWDVINAAKNLRDNLKVFVLTHDETIQDGFQSKKKIKTVGKMLDEKVTLEGLFTVVLFTDIVKNKETGELEYIFITQNDGTTTGKSPDGMFKDIHISNDLAQVITAMDAYYEGD